MHLRGNDEVAEDDLAAALWRPRPHGANQTRRETAIDGRLRCACFEGAVKRMHGEGPTWQGGRELHRQQPAMRSPALADGGE